MLFTPFLWSSVKLNIMSMLILRSKKSHLIILWYKVSKILGWNVNLNYNFLVRIHRMYTGTLILVNLTYSWNNSNFIEVFFHFK